MAALAPRLPAYLERICRKLTGDNTFALPYWNWTTHPAVPDPFWDTSSSLYDSNRGITQSDQADASYIGASVIQGILNETNFELFASGPPPTSDLHMGPDATGMLEGTPHNNIHGFVGGDMARSFRRAIRFCIPITTCSTACGPIGITI